MTFSGLNTSSLTSSTCLLLASSIADIIGARRINLAGCLLTGGFIITCGLARTGIEFIMFRAMQGIALLLCLPTSIAIVANVAPSGRKRNIGFSYLGFVQPIGFSLGLVLEGIILDTMGWRFLYYLSGGLSLALFTISLWALPRDAVIDGSGLAKLKREIDWVGALMASTCLALFSYILATLTGAISNIRQPANIALLLLSIIIIPAFIFLEARRGRLNLPAIIPDSFQGVQHTSAIRASLRILPSLLVGFLIQLTTGLFIYRTSPYHLVLLALLLSAGSPLLMALISAYWPYWYATFPAQLLSLLSCDILFTIGLLAVSEGFLVPTQALAGAVFSTVAQFGISLGLTLLAVVAASVTKSERDQGKGREEELLDGYRASFWTVFVSMALACLIGAFGLRRIGKVGVKRD
ncbi:related to transporter (major facilitator superfamily) [Phialocephala subalpina]|uniref:Related to transporter (Major facilitator superfamily) n=1 Tax=Phialocephala subalpina TaxID=576137 RepID=A0A1L7XKG5_9HELO|nr:related to transporter (major facilitator superfamily) [Phialocephala subalpina]